MLTLNQIRAQVSGIRQKKPANRAVALKAQERWLGPAAFNLDGLAQGIVQADSELGVREALSSHPLASLVLLTKMSEKELGEDVVARLAGRKVHNISSQEILRELFKAKDVEPRLAGVRWMAEALAEAEPPDHYPPVAGGRLDSETAWEMLLRHALGFRSGKPDLIDLIHWARRADAKAKWDSLAPEAAKAVTEWLKQHAGSPAGLVLAAARTGTWSVPALALACNVVFRANQPPELIAAGARIEQLLGGQTPTIKEGEIFGEAGIKWLVRELEQPNQILGELQALDQLLRQLRAEEFAYLSDASHAGLAQRFGKLGEILLTFNQGPKPKILKEAEAALASIRKHLLANREPDRLQRAEMALRLCRWQLQPRKASATNLPAISLLYHQEGCFVDWARRDLYHGDSHSQLSRAYSELLKPVDDEREQQNQEFGAALVQWTKDGGDALHHVEDVIPEVVAPLARNGHRVLLLVLDGMSLPIFHELGGAFAQQGLVETTPATGGKPNIALAGLPTITEWSRRLLLTGYAQATASRGEEVGFQDHPGLAEYNTPANRPVLFLKGSLSERGSVGLSEEVRHALQEKRPVVGIVVNAIDDHLLKCDQLNVGWNLERIPLLQQILAAATAANRVIVVTSDHGHIIEHNTETVRQEGSDRYRKNTGNPEPREYVVAGGRVAPFATGGFIAPWSERIIYTSRKNGYHGGISPQEVIVPLAVLAQEQSPPDGWQTIAQHRPDWWFEATTEIAAAPVPPPPPPPQMTMGLPLFDNLTAPQKEGDGSWITALLQSKVFKNQLPLAGRRPPETEAIRKTLTALDERGGALLLPALAAKTGVPEFRLPGMLVSLRRILNVEGYPVLSLDENSGTVRLNRELLKSQFDLNMP